jgi:hypothetical protein
MNNPRKRPRDPAQLAKLIADIAIQGANGAPTEAASSWFPIADHDLARMALERVRLR